jgi:hypothetical protein
VSFASLAQPQVEPLIERFADARNLTLLVGAGASMEALLPSWRELVERLLDEVAGDMDGLTDENDRASWVARLPTRPPGRAVAQGGRSGDEMSTDRNSKLSHIRIRAYR